MERIVVAISPPSIFTLGSLRVLRVLRVLRRSSLTAADLGVFVMYLRLCSGYALGIERS